VFGRQSHGSPTTATETASHRVSVGYGMGRQRGGTRQPDTPPQQTKQASRITREVREPA